MRSQIAPAAVVLTGGLKIKAIHGHMNGGSYPRLEKNELECFLLYLWG